MRRLRHGLIGLVVVRLLSNFSDKPAPVPMATDHHSAKLIETPLHTVTDSKLPFRDTLQKASVPYKPRPSSLLLLLPLRTSPLPITPQVSKAHRNLQECQVLLSTGLGLGRQPCSLSRVHPQTIFFPRKSRVCKG